MNGRLNHFSSAPCPRSSRLVESWVRASVFLLQGFLTDYYTHGTFQFLLFWQTASFYLFPTSSDYLTCASSTRDWIGDLCLGKYASYHLNAEIRLACDWGGDTSTCLIASVQKRSVLRGNTPLVAALFASFSYLSYKTSGQQTSLISIGVIVAMFAS